MNPTSSAFELARQLAEKAKQRSAEREEEDKRRVAEEERTASEQRDLAAQSEAVSLQLPLSLRFDLLDQERYALPNSFARGGLFAAVKDGNKRVMMREEPIHSLSSYEILYTGDQLNQSDLDVLMALITQSRQQPLGDVVTFTAYSILRRMGWNVNAEGYSRLRESLLRLQRAQVQVKQLRKGKRPISYTGSFINNFLEADERAIDRSGDHQVSKSHWTLRIDAGLSCLFGDEDVTLGLWYLRTKLDGRSPLAQYLMTFFMTHREPLPLSVGKIKELSGSKEKNESNFIYRLENALRKLVQIGFLKSYAIEGSSGTRAMSKVVKVRRVEQEVLTKLARAERARRHGEPTDVQALLQVKTVPA